MLCELNDIKTNIDQETFSSAQEQYISNLILSISALFESYCNRTFASTTHTEYLDSRGINIIRPKNYPITSITSIHYDSAWDWDTGSEVPSGNYLINSSEETILLNYNLPAAENAIKIVYTAGYSTIPLDLKQACINEIIKRYSNRYKSHNIDVSNRTDTEGVGVTYNNNAFMLDTIEVLKRYRNRPRLF